MDPPFLRLYLDDESPPPTLRALEDAFFSARADGERPDEERESAWAILERWTQPFGGSTPLDWYWAILQGLRGDDFREDAQELGRFWVLTELFEDGPTPTTVPGYHELHSHLRGAVPYLAMWHGWIKRDRKRAVLRSEHCKVGRWNKTWAELVQKVASCPDHPDRADAMAGHVQGIVQARPSDEKLRYLITCAGLSAHLIYHRAEPGLLPFAKAYKRYSDVQKLRAGPRRQQDRDLVAATLKRFEEDRVDAVELRPTLDRRRSEMQRKLQDVVLGYFAYLAKRTTAEVRPDLLAGAEDKPTAVALGLVMSLLKQEAQNTRAEPRDPRFWQAQSEIWADEVRALLAILDEVPALRWFVVGIDAAGQERGCPLRALRPAYDLVRTYNRGRSQARPGRAMSLSFLTSLVGKEGGPEERAGRAWDALNERPVYPIRLGLTVHAGEDFADPMTGLRNIWEAAVDLDLGEGDRIGHALAAGLDRETVLDFFERRAKTPGGDIRQLGPRRFSVTKPRGTRMLDLAWISRAGGEAEARVAERMLGELTGRAFGAPVDSAYVARELGRGGALAHLPLPGTRYGDPSRIHPHDHETFIIDEEWLGFIEGMRQRVLLELIHRRLTVESCPTSNLVVPNLNGRPPLDVLADVQGLKVVVATDDPGMFACYPGYEINKHVERAQTQRFIDASREASFVRRV